MWLTKQYVMDEFAKEVGTKKYKKLDYNKWRNLRDATSDYWDIDIQTRISVDEAIPINAVVSWEHCIVPYEFPVDDNSFGRFLYDLVEPYLDSPSPQVDYNPTISNAMTAMAKSANTITSSMYQFKDSWDNAVTHAVANLDSIKANTCNFGNNTLTLSTDGLFINGKKIEYIIDESVGHSINGKENNNMTNLIKGFNFGSCENDNVKMSMYGIAVKNANGTWVSYDAKNGNIIDVDILNFNAKYLYKMPVAIRDIKAGDVVIHNRVPMFVSKVEDGKILATDPAAGEEKVILLTKNMFGFDFATKVVNLFGDISSGVSADAPFGNMLPMLMLADGDKADDMLPLMLAMGGGKMDMSNPMMLYFLTKDNKSDNLLPLMLMANNGNFAFGKTCHCDCDREG
jgi:hypothetical protein